MDIPFKLIFSQNNIPYPIDKFVSSEDELYKLDDSCITCISENISLNVHFSSSNSNDKCYFDLLDIVYKNDSYEEITYLAPSNDTVAIYNTDENYTGALIPGYYKITVVSNDLNYYTWLKISPKQLTEEQWITMRDEIESEITGLAQDILYKRTGSELNNNSPLPLGLLNKLELINNYFKIWPLSFKAISENPRFKITREYKLVEKTAAKMVDQVSIRKTNTDAKIKARNQIYTVQNTVSKDVLENKWLKYLIFNISTNIRYISKELDKYLLQIEKKIKKKNRWKSNNKDIEYLKLVSNKNEISRYKILLSSILNDCNKFLNLDWVSELPINKPVQYSLALQSDMNYRRILNFHNDLLIQQYEIKLCNEYTYYWKRTDQLYEIWGFLQFIKAITSEELGFSIDSGWIYDNLEKHKKYFEIPFLNRGETIKLKKDDIILHLVYDQTINNTDSNLLFTNGGTKRPDLRIDYYKDEEYIQSIIIDFKYRPLFRIWSPTKRTEVMDQLTSYADSFYSKQIFMRSLPNSWRLLRPIQQVWAVFPNHQGNTYIGQPRNFELIELTPTLENEHIIIKLKSAFEQINQTWLDISVQN